MRVHLALIVLVFAAARAHAEPATTEDGAAIDDNAAPTGGKFYLSGGIETVMLSKPPGGLVDLPDTEGAAVVDAGYRLGTTPIYARAAVAASPSGYVDTRVGIELRAGGFVKGIAGLDVGYQHDRRMVDAFYSVEGPQVAPRLGLEVGSRALWLRGSFDWRATLRRTGGGRAGSFGLAAGRDF